MNLDLYFYRSISYTCIMHGYVMVIYIFFMFAQSEIEFAVGTRICTYNNYTFDVILYICTYDPNKTR